MDRRLMFIRKTITPGGCLPLPWGYIHVYDHIVKVPDGKKPPKKHFRWPPV